MKSRIVPEPAALQVRRKVTAAPERVFAAWTNAAELKAWWGPKGVRCIAAEIDLRVGGRYRIGNELPDGSVLWIEGVFEVIEAPRLLEYTWSTSPASTERVVVRFEPTESGTEIIIDHSRIPTAALRDGHESGWLDCLDGLADFLRDCGA
jgi:uncharacterized protein YndB with AHSA1/START domain